VLFAKYYESGQIKEGEMNEEYSRHGRVYIENTGVDGRILLK
jgi:hypothetical protein